MLSLEEFIKKLSYSEYTSNLLHILNNKRYGEGGELFDHKKGDVISLLLKIVDGNIPTTSSNA
jgi:hypothetical protein